MIFFIKILLISSPAFHEKAGGYIRLTVFSIQKDGYKYDHTLGYHLIVGRDIHQVQGIVQNTNDQGADNGAQDASGSTGQACPSQDYSRYGVQFVA